MLKQRRYLKSENKTKIMKNLKKKLVSLFYVVCIMFSNTFLLKFCLKSPWFYLLFFFFFFFCYYPIYDCIGLVTVLVFKRRSSTFFLCNLYTFPYSNNCIQWTIFIIYILFFRSQADRPLVFCTMSFTPWKC